MNPAWEARSRPSDLGPKTRALTVQNPWAALIAAGEKDVENRSWDTRYRGWLLLHAGKAIDRDAPAYTDLEQPTGAFVAAVRVVGIVNDSASPWARPDQRHWLLEDAVRLAQPVPARGSLGLWKPEEDDLFAVTEQLSREPWLPTLA